MESLGEKLKAARETKGCTFDQVSRETNIALRYLEALEAEDFSRFPGEPYLLGFLRNYGEYLGLDPQDLIASYRTLKIQEQPIPVEQLLKKGGSFPVVPVVAAAVLLAGAGVAAFLLMGNSSAEEPAAPLARAPAEFEMKDDDEETRFYVGDSIVVEENGTKFKLVVAKLGRDVTLTAPAGNIVVELGQESAADLNGDGFEDFSVFVADLLKDDPSKGASLRLRRVAERPEAEIEAAVADEGAEPPAGAAPAASVAGAPAILNSANPYPFTLQATFRGYCLLRWEADRKGREERYFHKAETLNVQAQNGIRLWASNAGAVKFSVVGGGRTVDVEMGGPGEVVVKDLKWVKDDDGRYRLTVAAVE